MMKRIFYCIFGLALSISYAVAQKSFDSPWGVAAHPLRKMEWENIDTALSRLNQAGIKWLREDFHFGRIYGDGKKYDFERYDQLLDKTDQYEIEVLPILQAYDNEIAQHASHLVPIYKHPEEWRRYVRETVSRYHKKLKYWEIWNEPDGGFWKPKPYAAEYVTLLKIAYEEIKNIDSSCQVIIGGLCSWNANYLESMYISGAKGYFDILAVHPYLEGPDRNPVVAREQQEVYDVLKKNGDTTIQTWITEFGASTFKGQLYRQNPGFMLEAIRYSLSKLNRKTSQDLIIGLAMSPRNRVIEEIQSTRKWLPGITLEKIPFDDLSSLDPKKIPVLIGAEGLEIDEPLLKPLQEYVKKGGLLIGAGKVPFHTVIYQDKDGLWFQQDKVHIIYPSLRMNFDAFWMKSELPESTDQVKISDSADKAGLSPLQNIYVDRFLNDKNMRPDDHYYPIVQAFYNNKHIGEGMALYTYSDWKGGILASTILVNTGYTADEQADLLQRLYMIYLSMGVKKLFWYDLHNDGELDGEREHNFGLLNWDWSPKPAFIAYSQLTKILGATPVFVQDISKKDLPLKALVFKRSEDNRYQLAVWSTMDDYSYTVQLSEQSAHGKGISVRFYDLGLSWNSDNVKFYTNTK